jgi:hypothetical protein
MCRKTGASTQVLIATKLVFPLLDNQQRKQLLDCIKAEIRHCNIFDDLGYKEDIHEWEDFLEKNK